MIKDDKNKRTVERSGSHKNKATSLPPFISRFFKLTSSSSQQATQDSLEEKETSPDDAPKKKKEIGITKAAVITFCAIYIYQLISLNTHTFGNMSDSPFGEILKPILFIGGTIFLGIILTKVSVNIFGKEKTYQTYLPMGITAVFILFFFKGCVWFAQNWCPGC